MTEEFKVTNSLSSKESQFSLCSQSQRYSEVSGTELWLNAHHYTKGTEPVSVDGIKIYSMQPSTRPRGTSI